MPHVPSRLTTRLSSPGLFLLLSGLFFLAVVALFGSDLLFRGEALAGGDIVNHYYPSKHLVREQLRAGEFPHWNPLTFSGRPLQADIQVGLFYLPNLLFWFFPLTWAFNIWTLLHFWLGAMGMTLWMRRRVNNLPAALFSGSLYIFSGYATTRLEPAIVLFIAAMAWLPWMLAAWDRLRDEWRFGGWGRFRWALALAGILTMSVLSGAPQITFFSFLALGIYALIHAWRTRDPEEEDETDSCFPVHPRPLLILAATVAVTVGLCAVQILPTGMLVAESWDRTTGAQWDYITDGSMRPRMLLTQIAPFFFGDPLDMQTYWGQEAGGYHEVTAYVGPAALFLLAAFILARFFVFRRTWLDDLDGPDRRRANRFEIFCLILLILAVLLAPGRHSPFFWIAYHIIPGMDRFRVPARFLLFFVFAVSALSGWTLDRLFGSAKPCPEPFNRRTLALSAVLLLLGGSTLVIFWRCVPLLYEFLESPLLIRQGATGQFARQIESLIRHASLSSLWFAIQWLLAGGLLTAALALNLRSTRWRFALPLAQWGLLIFLLADLISYGKHFTITTPADQFERIQYPRTARVDFLEDRLETRERFLWFDSLMSYQVDQFQTELLTNRPIRHDLPQMRGYDPLNSRRYGLFMNLLSARPLHENPRGFMILSDIPPDAFNWSLLRLWNCPIALSY
ncbi:hypothetical protein HQ520_14810, partial [bacterium]|nr:hypothetical protein [bacterium]